MRRTCRRIIPMYPEESLIVLVIASDQVTLQHGWPPRWATGASGGRPPSSSRAGAGSCTTTS